MKNLQKLSVKKFKFIFQETLGKIQETATQSPPGNKKIIKQYTNKFRLNMKKH